MVYPGTLFHRRQQGIPMHSYENRSQIRALAHGPPCRCKRGCHALRRAVVCMPWDAGTRHYRPMQTLGAPGG